MSRTPPRPMTSAGRGNQKHMAKARITLDMVEAADFDDLGAFRRMQTRLADYAGAVDGYFWGQSCDAFARAYRHNGIVGGRLVAPPEGVSYLNYLHGPVEWLGNKRPNRLKSQAIIHESVTHSAAAAVRILKRRGLGTQIVISRRDGSVTQHCDILANVAHARHHNSAGVGVECINRFYGKHAKPGDRVISAVWAHRKSYIVPTEAQLQSFFSVLVWLEEVAGVPLEFPATKIGADSTDPGGAFYWGRWNGHKGARGCQAHHRSAHSDGLFFEHYALSRSVGLSHDAAVAATIAAASSGKRSTRNHLGG